MNTCTLSVIGEISPVIIICFPWLPDMGFTPGALFQILPEDGEMFFILRDENIRKYSELLQAAEEKNGTLTTVSFCTLRGILLEIEGQYIRNAGLDIGDLLIVQYEYGLIRVGKPLVKLPCQDFVVVSELGGCIATN